MRKKQPGTRAILAANLGVLMERRGWTQTEVETASGVSQRYVSSILHGQQDCTIAILTSLAAAFNLPAWVLLVPGVSADLLDSQRLHLLVTRYSLSGPEGQELLDRIAEREAHHNAEQQKILPLPKFKAR